MSEESGFGLLRRRRPILDAVRPRNVGRQVKERVSEERSKERMWEPGSLLSTVAKPMREATKRIRKRGN